MDASPVVFWASAGLILVITAAGAATSTSSVAGAPVELLKFITGHFDWLLVWSMGLFLLFCIWVTLGAKGRVRLGPEGEPPEFNRASWLAMLFSAGMGIGLLFYGVAEPMMHFTAPPVGQGGTPDAAAQAMVITFFHWGLHPWAAYTVVALALAFFSHRKRLPLTMRSTLGLIPGHRSWATAGRLVDVLAVVGTLFGVSTSLGLGATQINAGLTHVMGAPEGKSVQLVLIAGITAVATASVVSGIGKGVRRLSELNMVTAGLLLLFVLAAGPTLHLAKSFFINLGTYLIQVPAGSFLPGAFGPEGWRGDWTLFYWAWWISWSPFVGMFIARVSRGRTVRELVWGVLLAPTLATFAWFTVFGNTALHLELLGSGGIAEAVKESVPTALFMLLAQYPLATATSTLGVICVASFFITSSDSASLVIDIITSGGDPDPPLVRRVFWAVSEGGVAAILLVTGGLKALQTAVITTALPFCLVLLLACAALGRALAREAAEG